MNNIKHVSDSTFETEVLKAKNPVLVDFWAPWCGPCRMVAPILEDISKKFDGQLDIVKVNTDENQTTPMKYGIMAIPTLIIFKDGKEADRIIGLEPQNKLEERLRKLVSASNTKTVVNPV
ncbi:MAG: thioredoxin [Candidatus Aminicenantes bacterium]|nr:thioredoxin [Candidatus Aminicenantes bacterium]